MAEENAAESTRPEDISIGSKEKKKSILDKLNEKFERIIPWGKIRLCTGISLEPSEMVAVLVSSTRTQLQVRNLARIDIKGANYSVALRNAIKALNRKWKLGNTEIYISLSSNKVIYKFLSLPGFPGKQMQQAVHSQLKTDKQWDPGKYYLAFSPVRTIGNQTRVFACYTEQEMVKSIASNFSTVGGQVYVIEPDIVSFHRALFYSGMLKDKTLALVSVSPTGGQLVIFTESGIMLSRAISGKKVGLITEEGEEKPKEELNVEAGESFDLDFAIDEIKKSFNYYEYSLIAGQVDAAIVTGEPILLEPFSKRIEDELGLDIENFVVDIPLGDEITSSFDPLTYGRGLGAIWGGMK